MESSDVHSRYAGSDKDNVQSKSVLETSTSVASSEDLPRLRTATRTAFEREGLDEDFFKPIAQYEGIHRYDPSFEWEPKEERRIVRKLDLRICAWVCFAFFALQLDRSNIVQAVSDKLIPDLGMNTNDYNNGQTIFYVCFICAELPSQMISKRLGPDRWIPVQMVCWSLVASCQAFLTDKSTFYATRALLGLLEGGFIPDVILYLTYFYKSDELPRRLSYFWTSYQFTYIVSAFLAYGIFHLEGVNGLAGWRWLFALEGCITGLIGIATYFYLPPSPTQTASWFRGKDGWFNEWEEKIMVNRILRDDPSKGDMHNRQAVDWGMLWRCLKDRDLWPFYILGLSWMVPFYPSTQYLTLQLESDGFSVFETNLLSIPSYVVFILALLSVTWVSDKINERFLMSSITQWWDMALLIALELLPGSNAYRWGRYTCTILLAGSPYVHAIYVAAVCRNAGSVRSRTVASALYNMAVQVSNVIGSQIYRTHDAPLYRTGNKVLLGFCAYNLVLLVLVKLYYVRKNKSRAAIWDKMSKEEKEHYLLTTKDQGNRRLDFRFTH